MLKRPISTTLKAILVPLIGTILVSCSSVSKKDLRASNLHLQIGISYIHQKNYPAALRELLNAESLSPKNPIIQNNLGLTYFLIKKYDLSEKHLRKAIYLSSEYTEARNNLSRVLIEREQFRESKKHLDIVLKDLTYPHPEKAWINLGLLEFQQKKYEQAKNKFLKAIEIKRKHCVGYYMYGRSLYELQEFHEASASLDRAIKFCELTSFPEPYYYSGLSYYHTQQPFKARSRFEKILEKFPNHNLAKSAKKITSTLK